MAERLGGSAGRKDAASLLVASIRGSGKDAQLGGSNGRPLTPGGQHRASRSRITADPVGGGLGGRAGSNRPSSAPALRPSESPSPERVRPGAVPNRLSQVPGYLTESQRAAAQSRVEELRQVKEAQYWGRIVPPKRDLPAFWSVASFGQPFNDERLASGITNIFRTMQPTPLNRPEQQPAGPATQVAQTLRKSLEKGCILFDKRDLSPLPRSAKRDTMEDGDREFVLNKMPVQVRIHALRNCLDRDVNADDFVPWTQAVMDTLDARSWRRNKESCIRVAVLKIESMMRHHLKFLSKKECRNARAPAALDKDILKRAFWKVDPHNTGYVSLMQFLQVWQNVLQLWEYDAVTDITVTGKERTVLKPKCRFLLDRNAAAALFVKYGFDKDGLLPYVVFIHALHSTPARLLGHEVLLDNTDRGKNGLCDEVDIAMCVGDAKILYPKCKTGVMPPSGFDPRIAYRSSMLPKAHMWLDHVYGYAGMSNLSNNLFYTHNTNEAVVEVVYYVGSVGVVFSKAKFDEGKNGGIHREPCQRFFFGHTNDIQCLCIHPNRRFVATGQQCAIEGPKKNQGTPGSAGGKPYVCIWDVDTMCQLQRLDHDHEYRSVIAVCFSGMRDATEPQRLGGSVLLTVTSDDRHTIHVWRWMTKEDHFVKAQYIPGWYAGPEKRVKDLKLNGWFFEQKVEEDPDDPLFGQKQDLQKNGLQLKADKALGDTTKQPWLKEVCDPRTKIDAAECGIWPLKEMANDGTWEKMTTLSGCNGTPPVVYGVEWNPFKKHHGGKGCEFCSYGVKHLKTWLFNDEVNEWMVTTGSFGPTHIQNVLSACYVPALHSLASQGDACILTGFANGQIGLWVPPYPTRPGSQYQLTSMFNAHRPGPLLTLVDGTQTHGGVRVLTLRADGRTVLSGGSDGFVMTWRLVPPEGTTKSGVPKKGVGLIPLFKKDEEYGPHRFKLAMPTGPMEDEKLPMVRGLDCHPARQMEFIAGTDGCDIWEVDQDPRVLVEGHEDQVDCCAVHPTMPNIFATACSSNRVRIWDAYQRDVVCSASVGFSCATLTYSTEPYEAACIQGWSPAMGQARGFHLAVSSKKGRIVILDAATLQPLVHLCHAKEAVTDLKYSPPGTPPMLAAASDDMKIYIYSISKGNGYQLLSKCTGHSGSVRHIDWSLPLDTPLKYRGRCLLQSSDTALELLNWNPLNGRKVAANLRDAKWYTVTCTQGFHVMGIWPDGSDGTDVNAVDRSNCGKAGVSADYHGMVVTARPQESSDGIPGAGFLVTAEDFSFVKLFNFPAVWDDAPFKAFRGHASFVQCVRFCCDDRTVISVGGADRAIFQWRTCGVCPEDSEQDNITMAAWQTALRNKDQEEMSVIPKPLSAWGCLDPSGKNMGPLDVARKLNKLSSSVEQLNARLSATNFLNTGALLPGCAANDDTVRNTGEGNWQDQADMTPDAAPQQYAKGAAAGVQGPAATQGAVRYAPNMIDSTASLPPNKSSIASLQPAGQQAGRLQSAVTNNGVVQHGSAWQGASAGNSRDFEVIQETDVDDESDDDNIDDDVLDGGYKPGSYAVGGAQAGGYVEDSGEIPTDEDDHEY